MRGPKGRSRHPIRRTWQCPHCQKRITTHGRRVHVLCNCTANPDQPHWMKLVDEPRPRPFPRGLEPLA